MKLESYAEIRTNFESADFWLQRKGNDGTIGRPTRDFNKENIGIKVTQTDKILPDFLYYMMEYIFNSGYWRQFTTGTLDLENLRVEDVKNLELEQRDIK